MSLASEGPFLTGLRHELDSLRGNWFWFLLLGIILVVTGVIALGYPLITSVAVVVVFGVILLFSGAVELVGAFWCRAWSGFFLHLLSGVLAVIVGLLFLRAPISAELALTLLIASFLLVGGIFKIVATLSYRFANWFWPLLSGVIDVVLGLLIWGQWPISGLWVIGLFVGISMIFRGVDWIMLGLSLRALPRVAA